MYFEKLPELVFLTDSHGIYFKHAIQKNLLNPFKAEVCLAHGATISGLKNPNSLSAASKKFKDFLVDKPKESIIFIQLGEVDCGILMWLKAEKNASNIKRECSKTIETYMNFINELKMSGFNKIVVTAATVPTIDDNDHVGEVISARRKQVKANYRERTDLTFQFNKMLENQCKFAQIDFIDPTQSFINSSTNLSDLKFKNKDRGDHHMDNNQASIVWAKYLQDYLFKKLYVKFPTVFKTALSDSYIKKLNEASGKLSEDMLFKINKGDNVSFQIIEKNGKNVILTAVEVNNIKLSNDFKFAYAPHFYE